MSNVQPGILAPVPGVGRYLTFAVESGGSPAEALQALARRTDGDSAVIGIGEPLLRALGREVKGMEPFPSYSGAGFSVPATPAALWCWLRGEDRGVLLNRGRSLVHALAPAIEVESIVDAFRFGTGRDLTGYEDGTENPKGDDAVAAAAVSGAGAGMDGSSFVAVQQWVHDLDRFQSLPQNVQDNMIGRRKSDNEELDDAPDSAHVKRTAQESFSPEAFVLRRSMPWADSARAGLMFVAFGRSVYAFAAQLKRMAGAEDGVADALFTFSRPTTGGYFWCPPVKDGKLDLSAIGL
ncbi:MAG TPA: Dyp-type peroxidase [Burkholderiales bacterium]|nr:Dyp-type peroxidase [Burkholderiales bacterium]